MIKKLGIISISILIVIMMVIYLLSMTGCGGSGNDASPTPPPPPPAPSFVTVTPADKQLTVDWVPVYSATGYEVWYSTTNDPLTAGQVTQSFTGTTCIISELTNGTKYFVWIMSVNSGGKSGFSSVGSGTPVSPISPPNAPVITVTAADKELTVSWFSVYGATGYEIWYSSTNDPSTGTKVTQSFTGTSCIITGLTNGTTYYVWVKSLNSAGSSGYSSVGTGKPVLGVQPPAAPNMPTLKGGDKEITVIWSSVEGATGYEVWYGTANDTSTATKSPNVITGTGTTITALTNGTKYYVWVKAVNSEGASGFSPGAQVTLEIIYHGSIRGLVTSSGNYSVTLVEQNKTQNFYSTNQYFYFNSLPPGTYHVRVERAGYEGILKEVYLAQDAILELGSFNIDSNPLPDGNAVINGGPVRIDTNFNQIPNYTDLRTVAKSFNIPQNAISATVTYNLIVGGFYNQYVGWGKITRTSPSPIVCFELYGSIQYINGQMVLVTTGSTVLTNLIAGDYTLSLYGYRNDSSYISIIWKIDNGYPQISVSKTWSNSTAQEVYVSCSDVSGIKKAQYYVSKNTVKPTNFNDMMANYNVQIQDKGIWYLHVQATDNENNVSYRCVGPFIVQ